VARPLAGTRILIATASNWPSTAMLPRLFGRGGAHVTVLCHPAAVIARSRYVDATVPVDGGLDSTVATLREHLRTARYDWIVAGDDPLVAALLRENDRSWLDGWFPFAASDPRRRDFATSKHAFLEIGSAANLPLAEFTMCRTLEELRAVPETFGFPFIAKGTTGHAGSVIHRIDDAAALETIWSRYGGATLAAQRFVRGPVATIEVLWDRGEPRCFSGAFKVDCHPSAFGAASAKKPFRHPSLESIARQVGAIMGYHGIGAIDVIRDDRTGEFTVLELNPRPSGGGFTLTSRIAESFYPHLRAFVEGRRPFATCDLGYAYAPIPLFPNNWYYIAELADKRRPQVWLRGLEALARGPFDDPKLFATYLRVFCGYLAERSSLGRTLKTRIKRTFKLRSARHPGAV
jgi:predicted ATP-grasp superfamily ATP-dependent carboligase